MPHGVKYSNPDRWEPQELKWWYQTLAQYMVANPHLSKKQVAKHFDKTPQCVYIVTNSDTFKQYYAQLMNDQEQGLVGINEKTAAMTELALDHMIDRLSLPGASETIPLVDLNEMAQEGLKRMGYGVSNHPSVVVQNNIGVGVPASELAAAREKYKQVFGGDAPALALPAPDRTSSDPVPRRDIMVASDGG